MVTDQQVRRLMSLIPKVETLALAASKAGMDVKTARKYRDLEQLPSELYRPRTWRTREDPFEEVWDEVTQKLELIPGLQAKTLFQDLQRRYPGRFSDGQLRTLQRRIKTWRALDGPPKEVFFPQNHHPGKLGQSDFTHMDGLGITIHHQPFRHLIYHFVLPFSNWKTGSVCYSESFESLSEGLQTALWKLGCVPDAHQTDRLTAAVQNLVGRKTFTGRYEALLRHYGLEGRMIQASSPHENGDVEQRHYRFKQAADQALLLHGSRDFDSVGAYTSFLNQLFCQLNAGRQERLAAELKVMRPLPASRLDTCRRLRVRVGPSSTIRVAHNVYSVHSRLIGEQVQVLLAADHLEVWYAQKQVDRMPRLRGESNHLIQYRHIIEWLVRKPGAFENYRYRADLFPTSRFRMAYDALIQQQPERAHKEYLSILRLAAHENETDVDEALQRLIEKDEPITVAAVEALLQDAQPLEITKQVTVASVDLESYDSLLQEGEAAG